MRRIAGLAGVLGLGLMLAGGMARAEGPAPATGSPYAADAASDPPLPQPQAGGSTIVEFLQCRTGCGPRCEVSDDRAANEHCKQLCERRCQEIGRD